MSLCALVATFYLYSTTAKERAVEIEQLIETSLNPERIRKADMIVDGNKVSFYEKCADIS